MCLCVVWGQHPAVLGLVLAPCSGIAPVWARTVEVGGMESAQLCAGALPTALSLQPSHACLNLKLNIL